MVNREEVLAVELPKELEEFIGDYHVALQKRADLGLLGESEFRCYRRYIQMYQSHMYQFDGQGLRRMFRFIGLIIYIDEDGKPHRLKLYPAQKFMLCGIFSFKTEDGRYVVNEANFYIGRRNGKSFLLSVLAHYLMNGSKYRNERLILASCKGQNATICFNEFVNATETNPDLRELYTNINRTSCWARSGVTGNTLEMFRTGAGAKKSLDGFTNKVAIIDEEMLCDEIITKTIQGGQTSFKDRLLVTMSTAQFTVGGENHKKWIRLRKQLYENALPDNQFLFLAEPDTEDLAGKDYANINLWGKANPCLLFETDGFTIKKHIKKTYLQMAKEAVNKRGFDLQNFITKNCNVWYSAEERSLCTYDQMKACEVKYGFDDIIKAGYVNWYLGIDFSQVLDLSSVAIMTYYGVNIEGNIVTVEETPAKWRLFIHVLSWLPKNRLQQHIDTDQFSYMDYVDKELFLCTGGGGDNIDTTQIYEHISELFFKKGINIVTTTADPYNFAGVQDRFDDISATVILQNQTPKALSQYIEAYGKAWKDGTIAIQRGHEEILEKAMTNCLLVRNSSGYYSVEKMTLRADSNIRIDPVDASLNGFIACYIDHNRNEANGDEIVDDWLSKF